MSHKQPNISAGATAVHMKEEFCAAKARGNEDVSSVRGFTSRLFHVFLSIVEEYFQLVLNFNLFLFVG